MSDKQSNGTNISELSDSLFDVTSPKYIIGVIFDTLSGGLGGAPDDENKSRTGANS